jgi:hypothetical protein
MTDYDLDSAERSDLVLCSYCGTNLDFELCDCFCDYCLGSFEDDCTCVFCIKCHEQVNEQVEAGCEC